jgi:glycosyltransferase involved in cell wall biosynthesis
VASAYPAAVAELLGAPPPAGRVVWTYTPLAMPIADAIPHTTLVYDVMDDLSSFHDASPNLPLRHLALLRQADVVFTGGKSLHAKVTRHRADDVHCFPSGVDCAHYASARRRRRERGAPPVAGYVGVIDERLDLDLVETLAAELPDWRIRMVGPVFKIEPTALPTAPNIEYPGKVDYTELPGVLSSFDVALMPFAHNEATRSISPTKTAEYLAAGLPVVSTAVADVARDFGAFVSLRVDGAGFAEECRRLLREPAAGGDALEHHLESYDWDRIVDRMAQLIVAAGAPPHAEQEVSA